MTTDPELVAAAGEYRNAVSRMPPLMPHVGLRYASSGALEAVVERLETRISRALAERVAVWEVPPYEPIDGLPDIRQIFVRTDVFSVGSNAPDQAIELQVDRART